MITYFLRRLLVAIPLILIVATSLFVVMRVVAIGDPASAMLGLEATQEAVDNLIHRMGLDRPLWEQYVSYMGKLFQGDLGRSMIGGGRIGDSLRAVLPYTLSLTSVAVLLSLLIGIPLGIVSALHRNRVVDHVLRISSTFVRCMPTFYLGLLLLIAFAVKLRWFPIIGGGDPNSLADVVIHLVLPALTLGLPSAASFMRLTRATFLEQINQDYVRTARAKGLKEYVVIYKHALRNCLSATLTITGLQVIALIGNGVLVENVFGRPGMGRLIVSSVLQSDYTSIQSLLLVYASMVILINLLTDMAYALVDPRIRHT